MRGLSLLVLVAGCASNPAPSGVLPTPEELATTAHGGYVLVWHRSGAQTQGELLAAGKDQVWVLTDRGASAIPVSEIESMRMAIYRTGEMAMTGWGAAGTISTLSHGFFLVISVPVWLITTAISTGVESRRALLDYPDVPLSKFGHWARYPQGMPPTQPAPGPPAVPKPPP
jgi:hypothetical protein